MRLKRLFAIALAAAMVSAGGLAIAQQPSQKPAPATPGGAQGSMEHGMMGGGMMGMMNMMQDCQRMMAGADAMMPKMPPGNEKLQFQMHAEMMQKVGEIAAKYAERIGNNTRSAPR
jgi:hypothetical protein